MYCIFSVVGATVVRDLNDTSEHGPYCQLKRRTSELIDDSAGPVPAVFKS